MNHEESLKYCEEQDALMLADERAHPEKYRGRGARSQRRLELILGNPAAKEEFERFVTYVSTPLKPKEEESAPVSRAPNPDSFVLRRCCRCAIYSHDPQAQAHIFIDNAEYKAHMNTQHSAWKELILVMVIPSDDPKVETQYRCPTVVCTFKASTEADVRAHCLEDCHENVRPRYIAMYNQDIILNRRQGLGDEIMRRGMEFFNNFENADTDPEMIDTKLRWKDVAKIYVNQKIPLLPSGAALPVLEEPEVLVDQLFVQLKMVR